MAGLSRITKPLRSTLADFAKKHKMDAMPGKQWEAYIKANAPKDAKKEAEASGLYDMLNKYEGKVTKDQIGQHLEKKLPKIKTKQIKKQELITPRDVVDNAAYEEPITLDGDRYSIESTQGGYSLLDSNGDVIRNEPTSADLAHYINSKWGTPAKYEKYTLPGGKDYQETLIQLERQMPDQLPEGWKVRETERDGKKLYQASTPSTLGREWDTPDIANAELRRYFANKFKSEDYLSGHFDDEPNILAHIRSKQRQLPSGQGVHFLEEIQSDWGQGLKRGEKSIDAPYVGNTEDWTKLALKKAIEEAAQGGQDYLAWTTGPQQADRYKLSKVFKSINYEPERQLLRAYDPTGEIALMETVRPQDLPNYIGHAPAQQLLGTAPNERGIQWLRDVDLDVGGRGMKTYYDQIVPSTANNLMKQLGLPERVETVDIPEIGQQPGIRITPELRRKVMEEGLPYFSLGAAPLAGDREEQKYGKGGVVRSRITELMKALENSYGVERAKRVERAADEVPNLENQYTDQALREAFTGGGDNASGLMIVNPQEFENFARPLKDKYIEREYLRHLGDIARQKGFDDVPYLQLHKNDTGELQITGHEGRHRTRALTGLGDQTTLVRMIPRASLREHLPRYSQGAYMDALREELGTSPLVRPEQDNENVRSLIRLPEMFAEGGEVDADEHYQFTDYGNRETGDPKERGYLGEIRMPNNRDVMTEYSINVDGKEMPSIIPGMHPADLNYIRETGIVPEDAVSTAIHHADKRQAQGKDPFWNANQDYDSMYEFI